MKKISYIDLLKERNRLKTKFENSNKKVRKVGILSNIIVSQAKEIFEYYLGINDINSSIQVGNYDNVLQDSIRFAKSDVLCILFEISNLREGFSYKAELMDKQTMTELIKQTKNEILTIFNYLKSCSMVIWNMFSALPFRNSNIKQSKLEIICDELNLFVKENAPQNFVLFDTAKLYSRISVHNAVDWRYWYLSKSLYSIDFFCEYAQLVVPVFKRVFGKTKKALILDCDNTLWRGVIGEDGFNGIEMSSKSASGRIFEEIQTIITTIAEQGIIIGLVSKNNPQDIDNVINNHPDMIINNNHIVIKKVNWLDKTENIQTIAKELNIGLDSIVFIDDSDFEINLVKGILPEVEVIQVPEKLHNYPLLLRDYLPNFLIINETAEDKARVVMYKNEQKRKSERLAFNTIEEYLKSLELVLTVFTDNESYIPRMAQMTQKTNQFNLTTIRYSESQIKNFVADSQYSVIAINVKDKFGDSGITGLAIIRYETDFAEIDTLLMSCRILGRNIEKSFMDIIIDTMKRKGVNRITSKYVPTKKNIQTKNYYLLNGFEVKEKQNLQTTFELKIDNYSFNNLTYIKIEHGK